MRRPGFGRHALSQHALSLYALRLRDWARPGAAGLALAGTLSAGGRAVAAEVGSAIGPGALPAFDPASALSPQTVIAAATMVGSLAFAVTAAVAYARHRTASAARLGALEDALHAATQQGAPAATALGIDDQRLVLYRPGAAPSVLGRLPPGTGAPDGADAFLDFAGWLGREAADRLEAGVVELRRNHGRFDLTLVTLIGSVVEAAGRAGPDGVLVRFRDGADERRRLDDLAVRNDRLEEETAALRTLVESLPHPMWVRDGNGRLTWVNTAYARAVESPDPAAAVAAGAELLDTQGRHAVATARAHAEGEEARVRLAAISAGERRMFDVVEIGAGRSNGTVGHEPEGDGRTGPAARTGGLEGGGLEGGGRGSGGIAVDVSELERTHGALKRTLDFHTRTLDGLATAVAIFGADRRLTFYNAAYRSLWGLDTAFLESGPEDGAVLDALRAARRLPEQANFRAWKTEIQAVYRAVEAHEHWWHLPDGQTLRVIANPHPQGGVTYIYENVTERLDLESRYNNLIRVQGETLDHLAEGVVVFGSDGRLRLWNPSFASIWGLALSSLADKPHVADVARSCGRLDPGARAWPAIAAAVTGLADSRTRVSGRLERPDGLVVDYATVPLPDGATLATFVNVTDSVKVERALMERNEALVEADRLKDTFIQHVSYELRSPLTNVIGFAQMLAEVRIGDLNEKQREYTEYIQSSAASLLAIIDHILDLATIDAGVMELDLGPVDVARTIEAAVEGLRDRLREAKLSLEIRVPPDVGTFVGDEKRVRQVLFNLVSNAISHSRGGGRIEIACAREGEGVRIAVKDTGTGIPADRLDQVFERFVSDGRGNAGLGLSIVKSFVELHGGSVRIDSKEGVGTTVICRFPARPDPAAVARSGDHGPHRRAGT
ncbi:Signal transduction histidine kinase [Pseudoxanthobacter soli DSM 19599]|uniref:histidine kinase n=1 Tax=Pseudoxanthobacter soli DSM 19599 TaxID=1123029 RepID=A0A1M7ZJB0_9HYPH|nr:Signal transduction histidine kinase [Pseudoxanthobacter soli DSM 19599]